MKYLVVPNGLKPNELVVYAWLYSKANHTKDLYEGLKKGEVRASNRTIAKYTGTSQQAVGRTIESLIKLKHIEYVLKSNRNDVVTVYRLLFTHERTDHLSDERTDHLSDETVGTTSVDANAWTAQLPANRTAQLPISFNSSNVNHLMSDTKDVEDLYKHHKTLPLPQARLLNDKRKRLMADAIDTLGYNDVCVAIENMSASSFLKSNKWFDFDWIYNLESLVKAIEGKYTDRDLQQKPTVNQEYKQPVTYYDDGED